MQTPPVSACRDDGEYLRVSGGSTGESKDGPLTLDIAIVLEVLTRTLSTRRNLIRDTR